ncbi:STAS/SEC14 domain-containing protein [Rhodococcus sp. NPDC003318]|uniref:STAS/SEC14 domain-containing protein n=1 Tax=Rhodococcus sp. NPDC003318 TaxID=3364503 RepID=UPI0036B7B452
MTIEKIPGLPAGTLGYRGLGVVTAEDYRTVFDPAIEAAVSAHQRVNLVYVLGDGFDRYSLGAMWQDSRLIGVPRDVWGRLALVTDHTGLGEAVHLLAFLFPGELRVFAAAGEADAIAWVSGG